MNKMILKYLILYMVIALAISSGLIYGIQTSFIKDSWTEKSNERLMSVQNKLAENDKSIELLTENISQNNLAKARAFSQLIADNPAAINSLDELNKMAEMLKVDELHITDEKGVLLYGNKPEYFGLDFSQGEQTKPFMEIIKNPSLEIAQAPQPNAAKGIVFQYIGVARKDSPGIVQVGIRPEILENMLEVTEIDNVLSGIGFGDNGYIFAIDKNTKEILAAKNKDLIGKSYTSVGFTEDVLIDGSGTGVIDGEPSHFFSKSYDDKVIGVLVPDSEYFAERNSNAFLVFITLFIIFVILLIVIAALVNIKIVSGVKNIAKGLEKIEKGEMKTEIREYGNKEFKILSDNINRMVKALNSSSQEKTSIMNKQSDIFNANMGLISNIKKVSENINSNSKKTLSMSDSIYIDSKSQEDSIVSLTKVLKEITNKLSENVSVSADISESAKNVVLNMHETKENMIKLKDSMEDISELSRKTESIIGEVDSIASQTNILSVNASIEASRAGEAGKGFAVVASQIGELAKLSTEAAKETSEIISNTILAIENGQKTVDQSVSEFLKEVSIIENASERINMVSEMTDKQYAEVKDVLSEMEGIAGIAEKNRLSSVESKKVSQELTSQVDILDNLIKNSEKYGQ